MKEVKALISSDSCEEKLNKSRAYAKSYRKNNPEKVKGWSAAYRIRNKDKIAAYQRKRYKENHIARVASRCTNRIEKSLASHGCKREESILDLIGCSWSELADHIESKFTPLMSWEKFLLAEIHLDHIKPIKDFDLNCPSERMIVFNYTNINPIFAHIHISKTLYDLSDKECLNCFELYFPTSANQKFCSKECCAEYKVGVGR